MNRIPMTMRMLCSLLAVFLVSTAFSVSATQASEEACSLYVPNIFSPNDDGINDLFQPATNCALRSYQMKVFSRWGRQVFESRRLEDGWNGKANGAKLPAETYVYYIQYSFEESDSTFTEILKGDVSLVR
ncbi:MAG: gliding motility-associated C-terminal domain-containing protein [Saprospiraceae bacterium]|nr:gliding motility-associated C-terminal domain-containing protein [Saprospiraceae bacterium]